MARFSRVHVWSTMESLGLVPLFYHGDAGIAMRIIEALAAGGAKVVEFTNRGDRAFEVFREVVVHFEESNPDLIIGAGSILDPVTAGLYINLGASFVVGSVMNAEVARLCNRRKVAYFPGCATASEVSYAEELGVEICKIFPGSELGGPGFVKAILGPTPWSRLMPTGGVSATRESLKGWFDAGVVCVGMGSALVRNDLIKAHDWQGVTDLTAQCLAWIQEIRG
ncbi:MAG: bifunctional 4-hydroxy-2-oxoglutarate aldolase/2-dehydro-3-deoxy-phosphogluconate aldolase [Chloroflexi bacterium]|nr:bifunctional 4-hydroxy-2-oxoglutarate aldolase/2-dehydro-3-deoxy-phosphogluconate aldolase [Chloroflexota bacterium]